MQSNVLKNSQVDVDDKKKKKNIFNVRGWVFDYHMKGKSK